MQQVKPCKYINMTSSALVKTGKGILIGFFVNSTSAGTIKFWDQTTAAVPVICNTITPAAGQFYPVGGAGGIEFINGLFVTISATLDVTVCYN